MPVDKISKIDKIEENKKAQDVIKKAQNSTSAKDKEKTKSKGASKAKSKSIKKTAPKEAPQSTAKTSKKQMTFALGAVSASEKKIVKIEAFFAKFIKDAKDKNDFIQAALMQHIKKCKKKFKKK